MEPDYPCHVVSVVSETKRCVFSSSRGLVRASEIQVGHLRTFSFYLFFFFFLQRYADKRCRWKIQNRFTIRIVLDTFKYLTFTRESCALFMLTTLFPPCLLRPTRVAVQLFLLSMPRTAVICMRERIIACRDRVCDR